MQFINLTPHEVVVLDSTGIYVLYKFPTEGSVRLSETVTSTILTGGIPVVTKNYGVADGLPAPREGIVYIVSKIVLDALRRPDLVAPDTGPESVVRDEHGHIIGIRRFQR